MDIRTVETPELGDRSYLVHDGEVAVVVDPQRDIDRVLTEVEEAGVRLTHVLETHIHNDYVSGGAALARHTGATYVVSAADDVAFDRVAAGDGSTFTAGGLQVRTLATPGHTVNHLAYLVTEDATGGPPAVFTGGSLLFGSVGRTDLVDPARTDELTRAQWRSARMLADRLPAETLIYPTHGFGSFCSSGPATVADVSSIGEQMTRNNALTDDEDVFVADLMAGLAAYPGYYAHMAPLNRAGAAAPDLAPPPELSAAEVRARLARGEWVVDLRNRRAFAAKFAVGSLSFEHGANFTTYLGWVLPWEVPMVLIGDSPAQVAAAQRDLSRIGIDRDRLAGAASGPVESVAAGGPFSSYPVVGWEGLLEAGAGGAGPAAPSVLDVRRADEHAAGHLRGSANIPLHELLDRLGDVPDEKQWVHCASGFRAGIAASILARAGHDVVHVDDDWDRADEAGLPVVSA